MEILITEPLLDRAPRVGGRWKRIGRQFTRNRLAVAGTVILLALAVVAIVGPFLVADPRAQDVPNRFAHPSRDHWFGTDELGRDIFARTVNGARISLASALAAVAVALSIGTTIGLIAGYLEGKVGLWLMAFIDLLLAIPAILLAITLAARLGPGLTSAMIAAALVGLPAYARLARGSALAVKRQEYVTAAQVTGTSRAGIIRKHIFPNILTPVIIQSTIGVGNAILLVSALGYLGVGAQPPTSEWGRMLSDAQKYILTEPYIAIFPGVAIALTVIGFNLAGDGLRDAFDPVVKR
ncbi:MAG TPA: ABC transporter permease [Thermomicrobiales bacterium]|nr:ABC transporter permease [Thermomicrobiales bacterium]